MKLKKTKSIMILSSLIIIATSIFTKTSFTFAKEIILKVNEPKAFVDEIPIQIDSTNNNAKPFVDANNRTLIPLRFISEQFEANVFWENNTITINYKDTIAILQIGDINAFLNGTPVKMDTAPIMKDEKVYVPLRFLAESVLDKKIEYDNGLIAIYEDGTNILKDKKHLFDNNPLVKINSKKELADLYSTFPEDRGFTISIDEDSTQESAKSSSDTGSSDYSKTNVQVDGVDEADIFKTDGKYIYYISNYTLYVVDATDKSKLLIKKQLDYDVKNTEQKKIIATTSEQFSPMEMYLDNDTLTLIGGYSYNDVKVIVFDLKDLTLNELRTFTIEGYYKDSRKIGDYIYLISQNNVYDFGVDKPLPICYDSATKKETELNFDEFYYIKPDTEIYTNTFLNISSINTKDSSQTIDVSTYLTNVNNVYSSIDNLYLSSTSYNINSVNTRISKFNLNKGDVSFVASQTIEGNVLNQFSMDEHDGNFRVCTTTVDYKSSDKKMYNNLFIYDKNLNLIGQLNNLAKDEKIYSARFLGDRIYIVTFKQIDPLFVIDAKDPAKPYVQGELKIPGYSTYLHPYDENHIIGFGMDTTTRSSGSVTNAGFKMALFDITDVNNPKEKFNKLIGDAGTHSELISNHKALLFSKEKNLLAFPITIVKNESKNIDNANYYGNYAFNGAAIYSLDLTNGFVEKALISNTTDENNKNNYNNKIQRLIYIDDYLYSLSPNKIKSLDLKTYKEVGELNLR